MIKKELLSEFDAESFSAWGNSPSSRADSLFFVLLLVCMMLAILGGIWMNEQKIELRRQQSQVIGELNISAELPQQQKPKPKPPPKVEEKKDPIDLTKAPPTPTKEDAKPDDQKPQEQKQVQAVYGLRHVYSVGLGSDGAMSDAVIGKFGNTINKDFDTLKATKDQIKGTIVSVTAITTNPKFRKVVKPEYTPDMIANHIEGVVKVKILIDSDGKVKKAEAQNDLGYGTAANAVKACLQMEFDPAMRGKESVAVWIIVPVKFVLL